MNNEQLTVLVVDDDFRVASVHIGYVERIDGFRVVGEAHTAAEALALSQSLAPDVLLMDIYLPDGDGLAVVKQLLTGSSPPAVIMISAANDVETVQTALKLGVVHYLVKPFEFGTLVERMNAVRDVTDRLANFPEAATQDDINALFTTLRAKSSTADRAHEHHLAPTLQLVYATLSASAMALSASEVAAQAGISRATAQRALAQLEQSNTVTLELKYGRTGRPEHCYRVRTRSRTSS